MFLLKSALHPKRPRAARPRCPGDIPVEIVWPGRDNG